MKAPVGIPPDLAALSACSAVALSFPASRAAAYPAALTICQGATELYEAALGGKPLHFARFSAEPAQLERARAVLATLRGYRGLLVYAGGRLQHWARMLRVLECIAIANSCDDPTAHCTISVYMNSMLQKDIEGRLPPGPVYGPGAPEVPAVLHEAQVVDVGMSFPCRLLAFNYQFKLQADHPSSYKDQIEAGAVREGCDWCPHFATADSAPSVGALPP